MVNSSKLILVDDVQGLTKRKEQIWITEKEKKTFLNFGFRVRKIYVVNSSKVILVGDVLQSLTEKRIQKWNSEKNHQNKL